MSVTSFTLRSPCSWKLQCEMYVLQFYLNLFSIVLAQLRLTLRSRCIDASTSYTPSPLYIYTVTRSHPQIYLSTAPHPHICTSISHLYIHTVAPSHLSRLSFFLSTYLFSRLCAFTSLHAHIHRSTSTSIHLQNLYCTCASTLSLLHIHPLFLSFYTSFRQCWTITCLALGPTVV